MMTSSSQTNGLNGNTANGPSRPGVVILSSSLLVDRVLQYTGLVDRLSESARVNIWAASRGNERNHSNWDRVDADIDEFPEILPFREIPYNYLRRVNEYAWDYRLKLESRESMHRHVRSRSTERTVKAMKLPARLIAALGLERRLERRVEKMMAAVERSPEARSRFELDRPEVLISTGPFQYEQPAVITTARKMGIPTLAYIPSWDNVTTKNRMLFDYDGFIVWSEQTKKELHEVYPATRDVPVFVVGAPQFDIFQQTRFERTREDFCSGQGLDPAKPIIVYALGSPNFLQEHHGALAFAEMVDRGELGDVQLLVRPHPIHDRAEMDREFQKFGDKVKIQRTHDPETLLVERSQDAEQVTEWINTFRHADVVINLSSTVSVDAAIFDTPVVNLDFDPQPGGAQQELIKEINHKWNHFKPIAESGGLWLVNDLKELKEAVQAYLRDPSLHSEKRKWITEYVCGHLDGKCGERMAEAILEFSGISSKESNIRGGYEIPARSTAIGTARPE